MTHSAESIRTIHLDRDQMLVFDGGREGRLRVLQGGAWLTEEGDAGDAFLCAGSEARFHGRRTLIEALGPTQLQVAQHRIGAAAGLQAVWRQLGQAVRRLAVRHQLGPTAAQPLA